MRPLDLASPPLAPPMHDTDRLDAVRRRDPALDGQFVYSVRTTGVFCRPSCAARPARPGYSATRPGVRRANS